MQSSHLDAKPKNEYFIRIINRLVKKKSVHISDDLILAECISSNAISLQRGSLPGVHHEHYAPSGIRGSNKWIGGYHHNKY